MKNHDIDMDEQDDIRLASVLDMVFFDHKLILSITAACALLGGLYAVFATPIYRADMLIRIEDSGNNLGKSLLGDVSSMFETKTAVTAEMEILRSRTLASYVVDNQHLDFNVTPRYFPVFGAWLAQQRNVLPAAGRPLGGYAWGGEKIEVTRFKVPANAEGRQFTLLAEDKTHYRLIAPSIGFDVSGETGQEGVWKTPWGPVELQVTTLLARPGTEFLLTHHSHLKAVNTIQQRLVIGEKGKQSGIVSVELEDDDPVLVAGVLNALGSQYVLQNTERKSAEAQKSLDFLAQVLPGARKNLERAEERFVSMRNEYGTIDLAEEAKLVLERSAELRTKESMLKIKRDELLKDFTPKHPSIEAIDAQLVSIGAEIGKLNQRIRKMPSVEREVLGLTRDVKMNSEVLTNLLNSAQQMQLIKAGKIGSASIVDYAAVPEAPVKPYRVQTFLISIVLGLLLGIVAALVKRRMQGGVEDAREIEQATGLPVYASVPMSASQEVLSEKIKAKSSQNLLLAHIDTHDAAVESMRSFRTALQFAMVEAKNNIVMFSGTAPDIGKSFISANFAGVMADAGKRVLLVDLDLRKGHLNQYFGLLRESGFVDLISGERDLSEVVKKSVVPNLDFIATGDIPANPNAVLLSSKLPTLLKRLASRYDIVVVDTPPILAVTDPSVIAPHVGTTILVVREGKTNMSEIHEAIKRFTQAGIAVSGVLMNGVRARPSSYGYGYGSYRYRYSGYAYDSYRPTFSKDGDEFQATGK